MWSIRNAYRLITSPCSELQVRIRVTGFAPEAAKIFDTGYDQVERSLVQRDRAGRLLARVCGLNPWYGPKVVNLVQRRWTTNATLMSRHEIRHYVLYGDDALSSPWVLVTCPSCGRLNRTLTATGKIRLHNVSVKPGRTGYGVPCSASGTYFDEYQTDAETSPTPVDGDV